MILMQIFLDADGMLEGTPPERIIIAEKTMKVGALSAGVVSAAPSVSFAFELPDGRVVFAETSMKLFQTAARMFVAKYGDLTK